jgi:hypothetical protein
MSASSRGLSALASQLLGPALLLALAGHPAALPAYLAVHGAASAFAALVLRPLLPPARRPAAASLLVFVLGFFVPLLGVIAILGMAIATRLAAARDKSGEYDRHAPPSYDPFADEPAAGRARGGIRAQLAGLTVPMAERLRALLTVQSMPARMANPLIREMLSDSCDDLRLIAYGILDTREKTIHASIHAAKRRLAAAGGRERAALERHLAELYRELIYQGLVQGDLREHAAAQARAHVDRALAADDANPALHALSGEIALSIGDYEAARRALERGRSLGLPESRVLPYLAEVAFRARQFDRVRALARTGISLPNTLRIDQVIAYWRAG